MASTILNCYICGTANDRYVCVSCEEREARLDREPDCWSCHRPINNAVMQDTCITCARSDADHAGEHVCATCVYPDI